LDLSKKIGPLPLGAWIASVGGGLALLAYHKRQAAAAAPAVAMNDTSVPTGVADGSVGGWTATSPADGVTGVGTVPASDLAPATTTNEDWSVRAINGLIADGYPAAVADSAIRKYMDGGTKMGAQEFALVNIALAKYGSPPIPLPPPLFGPPTAPKPVVPGKDKGKPVTIPKPKTVSKPAARHYTVKPGDTLSRIGAHYGISWQSIYNANKSTIKNPNLIHPGQSLVIPAS
jgi:LysM repeat protein